MDPRSKGRARATFANPRSIGARILPTTHHDLVLARLPDSSMAAAWVRLDESRIVRGVYIRSGSVGIGHRTADHCSDHRGVSLAVNPHGINMGVLWLSGRTSLCLTLFSIGAAWAFAQHKFVWGAVFIGCALGSKEEAVALPFVLLVWHWLLEDRRRVSVTALLCAVLPLAVYFVLRTRTAAFTLTTAPSFYRLTADPALLLRNIGEYLDRSTTLVAFATLLVAGITQTRCTADATTKRVALLASSWWVGMLAITIWLPVRSSLYAVGPSVGSALLGAALIDRLRSCTTVTRRVLVEPVLAALVVAAIPIYQMRDAPWVEGARVSQRTLTKVREDAPHLPHAGMIVLTDQEGETVSNFRNAFGDLSAKKSCSSFSVGGRPVKSKVARRKRVPLSA